MIRDFYGALRAANADAGAVVTTGYITSQARLWAEGKPIFLYDGEEFLDVIRTTRIRKSLPIEAKRKPVAPVAAAPVLRPAYATAAVASSPVVSAPVKAAPVVASMPVVTTMPVETVEQYDVYAEQDKRPFMNLDDTPVCPACGVPMLLHTEKRLFFKPRQMYVCQNAPSCDETMEAE